MLKLNRLFFCIKRHRKTPMKSANYKSLVFWGRSIAPNTNHRLLVANDGVKPLRFVLFLKYCKRKDFNRQCCHRSFVISKKRNCKTSIVGACIDLLLILTRTSIPLVLQRWIKSWFLSCNLIRDIEAQKHILNSIFFNKSLLKSYCNSKN